VVSGVVGLGRAAHQRVGSAPDAHDQPQRQLLLRAQVGLGCTLGEQTVLGEGLETRSDGSLCL
jgi:hypothetical protein